MWRSLFWGSGFPIVFILRSVLFGNASPMRCAWLALALTLILWTPALGAVRATHVVRAPHAVRTTHERVCLTAAQAREMIALHRLAEPFRLMKAVAHRFQGEALRVKLCRRKDEFIYEISLLRRDGRVIHVVVNAVTGKVIRAVNVK